MSLTVKWIEDHVAECPALASVDAGDWDTPYWYPGGIVRRARDGSNRKHGATRFLMIQCNSYGCHAEVLVKIDDVLVQVPNSPAKVRT